MFPLQDLFKDQIKQILTQVDSNLIVNQSLIFKLMAQVEETIMNPLVILKLNFRERILNKILIKMFFKNL